MKPIKVIQIGIMHDHATGAIDSMLLHPEVFSILAVCPEERPGLAYEDFEGRLADVRRRYPDIPILTPAEGLKLPGLEAVIVDARERDLTYYAQMALDAGFPVHMDKPGGEDEAAFFAMIDTAKAKHLVFSQGYMYRQNPAVVRAKELIAEGVIGEVLSVEAHMNCRHTAEKRNWLGNYKGGMMFFLGCHLIDLIVGLQGEPQEVLALNTSTDTEGCTSEDYGLAMLRYPHGWSFAKTSANEVGGYTRRQLVISGTEGLIEIKPLELGAGGPGVQLKCRMRVVTPENALKYGWNAEGEEYEFGPWERYSPMLLDFAAYVRGEKENPYSYDYEKLVYRVLNKACGKESV